MNDFVNWCAKKDLIDISEDGTVTWKESAMRGGDKAKYKEKFDGGRDQRQDLSGDYKGHCHMMGTVWPFKVVGAKSGGKAVAPVGK